MSAMFMFPCPNANCQHKNWASTEHVGQKGACPSCGQLIEIPPPAAVPTASLAATAAITAPAPPQAGRRASATEVESWLAGSIGLALAAAMYGLVFLLPDDFYVRVKFANGGTVSFINAVVTGWGLAILALKFLAVRRQQSYADLELEFIPLKIGMQITPANLDAFLNHLARLPDAQRFSVLGRRIQGALEHFKSRHSVPEVHDFLSTQSELDASAVDSGYTLLRAFIWVNPILGFIGTVVGIGIAVGGLATSLEAGGDVMSGLGLITGGLATAFDTTLIGLVMATMLLFPTEMLRKTEYGMLDRIENFCFESLLRRMSEGDQPFEMKAMPEVVKQSLEITFREHQKWLADWQERVSLLGEEIGGEFERTARRVQDQTSAARNAQGEKLDRVVTVVSDLLDNLTAVFSKWKEIEERQARQTGAIVEASQRLETALTESLIKGNQFVQRQIEVWDRWSRTDLGNRLGELTNVMDRHIEAMGVQSAAGGQVVLAPAASYARNGGHAPPRRSLFGVFGRKERP